MVKQLYQSITGTSSVESVQVSTAHNAATSVATVSTRTTNLEIGDSVDITLGYVGDNAKLFSGYIKTKDRKNSDNLYVLSAQDELVRAVDYFIASSTPDNAFQRTGISAEFLIRDLLSLAGITNFTYDATSFTFATTGPLEINLIGDYDICKQITDILAWHLYADINGQVHFVDRKPYIVGGDSPSAYITNPNILSAVEGEDINNLRNRVVVYGKGDIAKTAQASSPYLPSEYYKSTVLATDIIDKASIAQQAANYNLTLLNRLTETLQLEIEGDASIVARDIVNVTETILGISDDYYAFGVDHNFNKDGYKTTLVLRK